jgi:hypothetical protein
MEEAPIYKGSCLCQGIKFEIRGQLTAVGHCHCSKCRKVSGTGSNAVAYASPDDLVWLQGEHLIKEFAFPDGWSSIFCLSCGSPLPKALPAQSRCFVPAGLLDDDPGPNIMGHIYVGSKASWDVIGDDAPQYDAGF